MWRTVFEQVEGEPLEWLIGRARQHFAPLATSPEARKIKPVTRSEFEKLQSDFQRSRDTVEYWVDLAFGCFPDGEASFDESATEAVAILIKESTTRAILQLEKSPSWRSSGGSAYAAHRHGAIDVGRWFVAEATLSDKQILAALALILIFKLLCQHRAAISEICKAYQAAEAVNPAAATDWKPRPWSDPSPEVGLARFIEIASAAELDASVWREHIPEYDLAEECGRVHKRAQELAVEFTAKAEELLEACDMLDVWRQADQAEHYKHKATNPKSVAAMATANTLYSEEEKASIRQRAKELFQSGGSELRFKTSGKPNVSAIARQLNEEGKGSVETMRDILKGADLGSH